MKRALVASSALWTNSVGRRRPLTKRAAIKAPPTRVIYHSIRGYALRATANDQHHYIQFKSHLVFATRSLTLLFKARRNNKKEGPKKQSVIYRIYPSRSINLASRPYFLSFKLYSLCVCPSECVVSGDRRATSRVPRWWVTVAFPSSTYSTGCSWGPSNPALEKSMSRYYTDTTWHPRLQIKFFSITVWIFEATALNL